MTMGARRSAPRKPSAAAPLVTIALALGCAGEAPAAPPPPPVRVEVAEATEIARFDELVATVRSRESIELRPHVRGYITEIAVVAGQRVEAGQVLMRIDRAPQEAAVSGARAATTSATAAVEQARAEIAMLEAQREAREADLGYAQQRRDRVRELFAADHASREDYDRAISASRAAEAQLRAVEAQIRASQAGLRSARSAVAQSASTLQQGRAQLDYYTVEAPIDGQVGDIPVHVGDLAEPTTLLTTLEGLGGLELSVRVPIELAPQLRPGLEVSAVTGGGRALAETRVEFISPQVDPFTQTVLVKCPLPEGAPLRVGQYARARVIWERGAGVTVPTTAVRRVNTQPFVFVVEEGDPPTVTQRPVRLGALHAQRYVVEEGLEPGERFVGAGIQRLADGQPVTLEAVAEPAAEASGPEEESDSGADAPDAVGAQPNEGEP